MKVFWILVLTLGFVAGCGSEKDADKIGDAQFCLDALPSTPPPTGAQIQECTDKVAGISSSGAMNILCSAGFIREGFSNTQRYVDATKSVETGTGQTQTASMMGILSFTSTGSIATDTANAQTNFEYCYKSAGKGATLLAAFSSLSMGMYNYLQSAAAADGSADPDCPATPTTVGGYGAYPLEGCIAGFPDNPFTHPQALLQLASLIDVNAAAGSAAATLQSSLGQTIITTNSISCVSGGNANKALCEVFQKAIADGGGTARGTAVQFFTKLLTP